MSRTFRANGAGEGCIRKNSLFCFHGRIRRLDPGEAVRFAQCSRHRIRVFRRIGQPENGGAGAAEQGAKRTRVGHGVMRVGDFRERGQHRRLEVVVYCGRYGRKSSGEIVTRT
jgi:hypothetical protein